MRCLHHPLWSGESPQCSLLKGPKGNGEILRERWVGDEKGTVQEFKNEGVGRVASYHMVL